MHVKRIIVLVIMCLAWTSYAQKYVVSDLHVEGNKKLKTAFVKKISDVRSGKILDSISIENDISRLKRLPSISHAYYKVTVDGANVCRVTYYVEENFTLIPSADVFTTNDDEFAFRLGLNEFNFLGRNISVGGFYQKDIYNSFAVNLRAPFLFSKHFGLAANWQSLTTLEPVFFENSSSNYKYNNTSYEVLGLYQFNLNNRLELGLNIFTEDYEFRSGIVDETIAPLSLVVNKWLVKGIYEFNALNYYYQYVAGFRALLNQQYVTSSDPLLPDFFIGWGDFFYFLRVGKKGNWANRLRMGLSTNADTPFAPFSVDNNLNVRGVGNVIDRGTGVIVLNTEYRQTIVEKDWCAIQANVFVDGGSWRNPGGSLGDFGDSQNIRIYPGLGFRFIHKKIYNAIFRLDYGYGVTKDSTKGFVFGIGQYF